MSTLKQQQDDMSGIPEEAIAEYLATHPDFFERHLRLLAGLQLPHRTGGPAVSLVERQVAVLRQQNLKLERKLRDLIDVARSNDELAANIHSLAILLLNAGSREAVLGILEKQLRTAFSADQPVLVLFDSIPSTSNVPGRFLRVIDRSDPAIGPFKTFLQSSTPRCGRVRDAQRDFLFGPENVEIGSVALIPLGRQSDVGFLAVGSRDADHFHPGKSIDFLTRLGELIAGALKSC